MKRIVEEVVDMLVAIVIIIALIIALLAVLGKVQCSLDLVDSPTKPQRVLVCIWKE